MQTGYRQATDILIFSLDIYLSTTHHINRNVY